MAIGSKSGTGSIPDPGEGVAVRARAAEAVLEVVDRGASLDAVIGEYIARVDENDRALCKELTFGSLRWFWRSKGVVERLVERRLRKADRVIEALLLVGIYQLDQMRLPAHAAIHSTVQACVTLGRPGLKGLVNGVLRNFQRRQAGLLDALPEAARDAHPAWLWHAIVDEWPSRYKTIIEANNSRPPMTLRVNTRSRSVSSYLERLRAEGLEGRALEQTPAAVVLPRPVDVERLPGFGEGWVSVQDASAQQLARLIRPAPGARILDACAAPGGKLTHMLEAFPGVEIEGVDIDAERAHRITENLERLHLRATVTVADAAEPDQWWDGRPFDFVLADVPCTGTGVIRRHPDIKVLRRASDVDRFAATQARLLDELWHMVKPDGQLIYVTCSILSRENQQQIQDFLKRHADARALPVQLPAGAPLPGGWQTLPEPQGGDGFYYGLLRKEKQ